MTHYGSLAKAVQITGTLLLYLRTRVGISISRAIGYYFESYIKKSCPPHESSPPTRPLEWGDINIIHTTDSHGWLLGHQKPSFPEPNYSGDLGDFSSFVSHMKEIAEKRDVDLLLIDSGDLHDGTGLTDGFPAGGVDAHDANEFFKQLPYDVLAIGNHELYIYANALDMYNNFAPRFNGRYLTSNVNITVADKHGKSVTVPIGSEPFREVQDAEVWFSHAPVFHAAHTVSRGRKVTSLGVLYDFTDNDHNTTVQKVEDMVKEAWMQFADAIKEEPDIFILVGHMPVARDNCEPSTPTHVTLTYLSREGPLVFNAVRAVHPHTPIIILGGHSHVRDCLQPDGRSMSLESGRYMETVGGCIHATCSGQARQQQESSTKNITFSGDIWIRIALPISSTPAERLELRHLHWKLAQEGSECSRQEIRPGLPIRDGPTGFHLSQPRSPYPSNNSLLTQFIENAVPVALAINNTRASIPSIAITNSGSQRFDIYAGPFTKNDQLTVSPFADAFLYIPELPLSVASQILPLLNNAGAENRRSLDEHEAELWGRGVVDHRYRRWMEEMDRRHSERRAAQNLTLGYVTQDSCPGIGDDIPHAPIPFNPVPDFIGSKTPDVSADTPIDLIFRAECENVHAADVQSYSPVLSNQAWGLYAQVAWN
ncbi:Metallo-dependent phosphatase-like protein [Infundibulicybe gibba]|nr:Metallo-dependent phosphatase-like protein [Infundibulicybe gibba]